MCIRLFSSEESSLKEASDKEVFKEVVEVVEEVDVVDEDVEEDEEGVKDIKRGIIFPPLDVTLIMALLVPLGHAATLTKPVGKDFSVVLPDSGEDGGVRG